MPDHLLSMKRSTIAIAAVLAVLAGAVVGGIVANRSHDKEIGPTAGTVDTGFARDMVVHHQQAVLMATYARQHAESDQVRALAGAIDAAQQREIGQMIGWLQSWGVPLQSDAPAMAWMGSGMSQHHHGDASSMPGMATPAELDDFVNLAGKRLDVEFLKLMTRHHEGGLPMAKYAASHAQLPYVRDAARLMIQDQQREIDQMRVLRQSSA